MARYLIDTTPTMASRGQNGLNHLRAAQADILRWVNAAMAAVGAPADYSKLEGASAGFGITASETPGEVGQAVYDFYLGVNTSVQAVSENFIGPIDQGQ